SRGRRGYGDLHRVAQLDRAGRFRRGRQPQPGRCGGGGAAQARREDEERLLDHGTLRLRQRRGGARRRDGHGLLSRRRGTGERPHAHDAGVREGRDAEGARPVEVTPRRQPPTASLNDFPAFTRGTVEAGIEISLPVAGLRPVRAARSARSKVRNPGSWTLSPPATASVTTASKAESVSLTDVAVWPVFLAIALTSSVLFIRVSVRWTSRANHAICGSRPGGGPAGNRGASAVV